MFRRHGAPPADERATGRRGARPLRAGRRRRSRRRRRRRRTGDAGVAARNAEEFQQHAVAPASAETLPTVPGSPSSQRLSVERTSTFFHGFFLPVSPSSAIFRRHSFLFCFLCCFVSRQPIRSRAMNATSGRVLVSSPRTDNAVPDWPNGSANREPRSACQVRTGFFFVF